MRSLPMRVLAVSFIVLALPLLIDTFIFFQRAYDESINDAKEGLKHAANFRAYAVSELDPVRQVLLKEISVLLNLEEIIPQLPNKDFIPLLQKISAISSDYMIYILKPEGSDNFRILAATNPHIVGRRFRGNLQVKSILETGIDGDYLQFHFSESKQEYVPYIYLVRAIQSKDKKETLGILVVSSDIEDELIPMTRFAKQRDLTIGFGILNREGIVIAASENTLVGQYFYPISEERKKEILKSTQFGTITLGKEPLPIIDQKNSNFFEFIFKDQVQIGYQVNVPKLNLHFLAYTSKEQLFSKSIRHFLVIYTIYALIFIFGIGVTYWLSNWISRPLSQLCRLMEQVGRGNYDVRFKEEPLGFEVNVLGSIFNQTLDSLFENIQKVEKERILKETYFRELEIGHEVQRNLLSQKKLHVLGVEIAANYIPTKEVGGDFFDITVTDNNRIALTVGDASGKGISTSLFSLGVRSLIRTYLTLDEDAGKILSKTNNLFLQDTGDSGMFVTALMGIYNPPIKTLSYYSCGHVPGIIRRADGQLVVLRHSGMALGLIESKPYATDTIQLNSGDIVLFYTDGLVDAVNEKHQHFTEKRLCTILQQRKWDTADELIRGLTQEIQIFIGRGFQDEEIIMLAMKVE